MLGPLLRVTLSFAKVKPSDRGGLPMTTLEREDTFSDSSLKEMVLSRCRWYLMKDSCMELKTVTLFQHGFDLDASCV